MVLTNFPNGVTSFGIPQLGNGEIPTGGGNYYFVSSVTGSDAYPGTWENPLATLDAAVNKCTADNGDVIVILPNHAESLTADSAVDIDVAGVTVIGLGSGDDRPTFTFTTAATADFKLAANNVTVKNLLFIAGIDALTGPIEISADYCSLINCEYREDTVNNYETIDVVVSASTPLHMLIDGFKYVCDGGAGGTQNQSVIQLSGSDFAVIKNCWIVADSQTGVIEDTATSDQILIDNCHLESSEVSPTPAITATATTTGSVRNCSLRVASGTTYVTATTDLTYFETYGTGDDNSAGEKVGVILAGDLEGLIGSINSTTTDNLHGKLGTDTEMADRSVYDLINGGGPAAAATAAAPGNNVSLYGMTRDIWDALRNGTGGSEPGTNTSLHDVLAGAGGIVTWADPAAPADTVSLAEGLRWISSRQGVQKGINPLGSVFYVAAAGGSDAATGGGKDPTEPLATVAQAIANASAGDTIVLGPGTHSVDVSASALVPKANLNIIGALPAEGGRPTTVITHDADDGADLVTVDVSGVIFRDITFLMVAGGAAAIRLLDVAQTTAVTGLTFIDCWFDLNSVDAAGVTAINMDDATNAVTGLHLKNCRFTGGDATTNQAVYLDIGIGGLVKALIEDCTFELESVDGDAKALLFADPGAASKSYGNVIRHNYFVGPIDGGSDAVPIEFNAAMTEDEIIGIIAENYFAECAATPITASKVDGSIVSTSDVLFGGNGIPTWPDPVKPGDAVSLAEAIRMISSRQGVINGFSPFGKVVYVAATGGSDAATGGGEDPTEPLATVAAAITSAAAGGTIVLGPGTHSVDVSAAALTPLANQKFIGAIPAKGGHPTAVITADADDGALLVNVNVSGVTFEGITFQLFATAATNLHCVDVSQTTAVTGLSFTDCEFDLNDSDGNAIAIAVNDATNATTGMMIDCCRFKGGSATTGQAIYIDVGVGGIPSALIRKSIFECESADGDCVAVNFADPGAANGSYGWTFRENDIVGPTDYGNDCVPIVFAGAMTEGEIIGIIRNNWFSCCSATPITQDKANQSLVFNYVGDAATGGTIVDPGT